MIARGFTTIELLVTTAIIVIVFTLGTSVFSLIQQTAAAPSGTIALEQILGSAARRARAGVAGTAWGVYLPYDEVTRHAGSVTVFSGNTYATRNVSLDSISRFNEGVEFTTVDLSGAQSSLGNDHEIIFASISGQTSQYGSVTLNVYGKTFVITITEDGFVVLD